MTTMVLVATTHHVQVGGIKKKKIKHITTIPFGIVVIFVYVFFIIFFTKLKKIFVSTCITALYKHKAIEMTITVLSFIVMNDRIARIAKNIATCKLILRIKRTTNSMTLSPLQ